MLVSEVMGWHYYISWDNPVPANSSAILNSLKSLGKVSILKTKTSIVLFPKTGVSPKHVRNAIYSNLNQKNGSAFYVT
jgi:hypothetical protein